MIRIKNEADLRHLQQLLQTREAAYEARVLICMTGCRAMGAAELVIAFRKGLKHRKLEDKIRVIEAGCLGQCSQAPLIRLEPAQWYYGKVKPEDVEEIIEVSLLKGQPLERLLVAGGQKENNFFAAQQRIVLEHCGSLDPGSIEDAICQGSYQGACKALTTMQPEEVISEVKEAGLRGRGGAGFPAGVKWGLCRQSADTEKYLICNADEGDPGAFMDRALLEGTPHQVIEGMLIAAYAIGATRGFIYVRLEYPIAVTHIRLAIDQARRLGLLGADILGSGFTFDLEVRMGAGAFVCGEETALIASLEGRRGIPRPRPPFPAVKGYQGHPTNINNVETHANVPAIILKGKEWYRGIGTESSKGTKIFALAGKVAETGLVEVPMGITIREMVFKIGGGIPGGRQFKAVQMGGPSGGCIPAQYLDLAVDYESVQQVGAIMGSGGMIVMDDETCIVDIARFFMKFVQEESCGKCVPCRAGTRHMLDILNRICAGEGRPEDIGKLKELAVTIKATSLCGLGQTAPNPVLSTLTYFHEEYEEHISGHNCRAGVCKPLFAYRIIEKACTACGVCRKKCPEDAITGEKKVVHEIIRAKCTKCGICYEACRFEAIEKVPTAAAALKE